MRVLLIRHGQWVWQPATNEADFPLEPQAEPLARTVRRAIRQAGLRPDAYLTTAGVTRETPRSFLGDVMRILPSST